jgi:glycosyltransferase involved in cell wall biosynthesis
VEKKGLADLLSAVAALRSSGRELRCRLVGSGPLEEALRAQVRDLDLEGAVEFIGSASQEQVLDEHLPAASAYVLPCVVASDGDRDGLPTTLLESMARGVPVVSTRLPGVPEAVPHGEAGLLADEGDVCGLTQAIASTLDDREATERRVTAARRHIETLFDSKKNTRQLFGLFEQAASVRGLRTGTGL